MSKFIENSKHGAMTAAVTGHFFGSGNSEINGKASGKGFPLGGDSAWNTGPIGKETGQYNRAPSGAPAGPSIFNDNIAQAKLPKETGVNYKPLANAGHRTPDAPFGGDRNGLAGRAGGAGTKLAWD